MYSLNTTAVYISVRLSAKIESISLFCNKYDARIRLKYILVLVSMCHTCNKLFKQILMSFESFLFVDSFILLLEK